MNEVVRIETLEAVVDVLAEPTTVRRLRQQWSRCLTGPASAAPDLVVDLTGALTTEESADETEYRVTTRVTRAAIDAQRGRRLLLHAAGVADPVTGRMLILVAESGGGKTTAAAVLGRRLGYVTDETVALDDDLTALPFPKPLSVVRRGDDPYDKSQHGPDELGLLPAPARPTAAAVMLLARDPERDEPPALEAAHVLDGLLALVPQTSALPEIDRPLSRLAALIERTGGIRRLRYREVADAADLLSDVLGEVRATPPSVVAHPPTTPRPGYPYAPPRPFTGPVPPTVQRADYTDAVESAGDVVVLVGANPYRLTGPAARLWLAAGRPVPSPGEVARELLALGLLRPASGA
ncbi:hypothetical protein [Luteipulveratus flavus]|uniref:AAA+ ATPase domain-containing protein n=1 Tax=Luteipulveratus flavus TaxID=3031728 RepID=A0ABT6CBQ4_9MICO|nr:hypothetical protein [Luteipulveratus sp. YIM 133296]MDF8264701.1 hypothetical protein [Luteipulveratus sp. YIM 133296]